MQNKRAGSLRKPMAAAVRIAKEKDLAVNRYLQRLLEDYVGAGGKLIDLADKAGVARSVLTQIRNTAQGAGNRTAPRIAGALGLDFPELYRRAHEWWDRTGGTGPVSVEGLPRASTSKSHPRVRELPGWEEGLDAARRRAPFVPERFFTAVGSMGAPPASELVAVDAEAMADLAVALYMLSVRAEASRETAAVAERVDAKRGKSRK